MKHRLLLALLLLIMVVAAPAATHAATVSGVNVVEDTLTQHLVAGASGQHRLRIFNTSSAYDNFTVQINSTHNWFSTSGVYPSYSIAPGGFAYVAIPVSVPASATYGQYDTLTVTVTSQNTPSASESSLFFTYAHTSGGYAVLPQLGFTVSSYSISEEQNSVDVTVSTTTGPVQYFASVDYATVDGSARACKAGSCTPIKHDYVSTSGRLIFYPGETSKTITIPMVPNGALSEPVEYFTVQLSHNLDSYLSSQASIRINVSEALTNE